MNTHPTATEGRGICPQCGRNLPSGRLAGLCPACLLAHGLGTDPGDLPPGRSEPRRVEAPSLETVRALFPHLEIHGLLGSGGMGAVYRARQPALDRWVALKVLPRFGGDAASAAPGTAPSAGAERFNREARALARLSHPNVVGVHEFGQVEGWHFFVMEYVDGTNLRELQRAGRLSPREALQIVPQICDALQYAHDSGVVHRDIKPENVLIDRRGRVKIADFGLAKLLDGGVENTRLTVEGQVMGTPHYMAPEQVERPLSVDHRADIYSLGVVLYEMLTGDLPLGKFAPPSRKVAVDVRLDEVVLKALENDPERRYQHASEVKSGVEGAGREAQSTESKVEAAARDWRVRWFGHSPEAAAIWRNMSREEKRLDFALQTGIAGVSGALFFGLWAVAATLGGRSFGFYAVLLLAFLLSQLALFWGALWVCRTFLASTRWARERGITAGSLRLYARPGWLGGPPGEAGAGAWVILAGLVLGLAVGSVCWVGLRSTRRALTRPSGAPAAPLVVAAGGPAASSSIGEVAAAALDWGPALRFLAWQPAEGALDPKLAWTPEGHSLSAEADLRVLREIPATRMDLSAREAGQTPPRFLQLWFQHPAFDDETEVWVVLSDTSGTRLVADGGNGCSSHHRDLVVGGRTESWLTATVDAGAGSTPPRVIQVRFDYVIGPLEQTIFVPASSDGVMSLPGGGELNSVGQNFEGKASLALTQLDRPGKSLMLGARAVLPDGRELPIFHRMRSGPMTGDLQLARFSFDARLADLKGFVIGSRPVRRTVWKEVSLRPPADVVSRSAGEGH